MVVERWKKLCARFLSCGSTGTMHANPRFDKWAHQPRPDRALMVNRIPLAWAPLVVRGITRFARRERAQTCRCKQKHLDCVYDFFCLYRRHQCAWQAANREDLVRPKCKVDNARLMIAIDYIGEVTSVFVPEFDFKCCPPFFEKGFTTRGK